MALDIAQNKNDPTMNEVLKQERISKIEAKINRNDKQTIKAVLEWVRSDKGKKKAPKKAEKKEPLNMDEIDTSMMHK